MDSILETDRWESTELTPAELGRYARHVTIPDVGIEGQRKLRAARVLCIGAGGLGSPIAMYLAAAGVGKIGIVDPDVVDLSNLQRQILHGQSDVNRLKLDSARDTLSEINPHVEVETFPVRFTSENAREISEGYDLIVDGTDNFATRYLSNDLAVLTEKPNVYGSIFRFEGQVSVFSPAHGGPCYRCLFPEPPEPGQVPSCAEGGVLGVLPGIVGCLQANEAIKLIIGIGEPLIGRLVHFDALKFRFRELKLRRDPECPVCGNNPTVTDLIDYEAFCGMPDEAEEPAADFKEITVHHLKSRMEKSESFLLLDVREPVEAEICKLPNSTMIPVGELSERLGELPTDKDAEIILHCKAGGRSAKGLQILLDQGYTNACHVIGGINAWSVEVDESVTLY